MHAELLVTGCYRSGTTLLEKLLHQQPEASVASQPFPALYSLVKELFDARRGLGRRYPLGHRFLEDQYTDRDFAEFLDGRPLEASDLERMFERLSADRNGLWTPEILGLQGNVRPGVFLDVYRQMLHAAAALLGRSAARVVGSKEILVEEYIPYLLSKGVRVILIVRDPRDMIASLDFSHRDNATGVDRPVLYSVRIWRKSVATALAFEAHSGFRWLRYEDLVANPESVLAGLRSFLSLPETPRAAGDTGLRDQHGRTWRGNSSFSDQSGVSRQPVGRFHELLPPAVRDLIEAAAGPEMTLMGYAPPARPDSAIADYRDPFSTLHPKFPAAYSADPRRVHDEIARLRMLRLQKDVPEPVARQWFIYPEAYRRLRSAIRHSMCQRV